MAIKTEPGTRVRISYQEDGKKKSSILDEERAQDWIKEFTEKATPYDVEVAQTYLYSNVSSETPEEDLIELVPDAGVRADLINMALDAKARQFVTRQMQDEKFTPTEGAYDLHSVYSAVSERKAATPEEKAANALSKLLGRTISIDEINAVIGSLQGASA